MNQLQDSEKLDLILNKLGQMEQRLEQLETAAQATPGALATLVNSLDDYMQLHPQVDADRVIPALEQLALTLGQPQVLSALQSLLTLSPALAELTPLLPQVQGMTATLVDSLDDIAQQMAADGVSLSEALEKIRKLMLILLRPETLQAFYQLTQTLSSVDELIAKLKDEAGVI